MHEVLGNKVVGPVVHGLRELAEEQAALLIDDLINAVNLFIKCFVTDNGRLPTPNCSISAIHSLCAAIEIAYAGGLTRDQFMPLVKRAYDLHGRSPFINRLQTWPRGYPGDFETVEWIATADPRISKTDHAYWIEWFALNAPIAQQHRNKLHWQRHLLEAASFWSGRVLNIGCGGCADLKDLPSFLRNCDFTPIDSDEEALRLARDRLKSARSLHTLTGDVLRRIRDAAKLGPYDMILSGGLFDYLPTRLVHRLIGHLLPMLKMPGGEFAFTNIAGNNPYRTWIEHMGDWRLIHRSEEEVRSWFADAGRLSIERDGTD